MSPIERFLCRSAPWRAFTARVILPWALQGLRPDARTLEVGGGSGAMAAALLQRFPTASVTVTDVDPIMVAAAEQRLAVFGSRAEAREADATALPFAEGEFDTVVSFVMLNHVGAWEQALAEAMRVLRPGGMLVGYDLLATPAMELFHRVERTDHRFVSTTELRSVLSSLPVEDVAVRPSAAGLVVRFLARRAPA